MDLKIQLCRAPLHFRVLKLKNVKFAVWNISKELDLEENNAI